MKELLYSKHGLIASVNVLGAGVSLIASNPIGYAAGVIALVAGILNLSIQYHKWKNTKEGWAYKLCKKLFRWRN